MRHKGNSTAFGGVVMGMVCLLLVTNVCSVEAINKVAQPWRERYAAESSYDQTITGTNSVIIDNGEVSGVVAAGMNKMIVKSQWEGENYES